MQDKYDSTHNRESEVYFETNDMQKQLLEEDGIEVRRVDGAFWVDLKRYGWKNTIEDVEMFRRLFGETKK